MTPTETLTDEHKVIPLVLGTAERECEQTGATGRVNAERVGKMLEFFRGFADHCHHAKEEKLLFVKMQERGMPREGGSAGEPTRLCGSAAPAH